MQISMSGSQLNSNRELKNGFLSTSSVRGEDNNKNSTPTLTSNIKGFADENQKDMGSNTVKRANNNFGGDSFTSSEGNKAELIGAKRRIDTTEFKSLETKLISYSAMTGVDLSALSVSNTRFLNKKVTFEDIEQNEGLFSTSLGDSVKFESNKQEEVKKKDKEEKSEDDVVVKNAGYEYSNGTPATNEKDDETKNQSGTFGRILKSAKKSNTTTLDEVVDVVADNKKDVDVATVKKVTKELGITFNRLKLDNILEEEGLDKDKR